MSRSPFKKSREGDTIKVIIRFKGNEALIPKEEKNWNFHKDGKEVQIQQVMTKGESKDQRFTFDHVLEADCSQEKMYSCAARETVSQFTKGYNGTIFTYGESGSGKTHTMLGPESVIDTIKKGEQNVAEDIQKQYGIIPRAIFDFFAYMNNQIDQEGSKFKVQMNYFEIYMESLNNLIGDNFNGN